jgi:diadenosine tetraphosphate (Ap4A) HIT family hydrolase
MRAPADAARSGPLRICYASRMLGREVQPIATAEAAGRCELCASDGGEVLWQDEFCRVVSVADPDYPGFCRVVLRRHVREMTDLAPEERARLMHAVFATESALRELMRPDKVNLASLGNMTQHLHWHVIPRFRDDRHFPQPVWTQPARTRPPRAAPDTRALAELLRSRLD